MSIIIFFAFIDLIWIISIRGCAQRTSSLRGGMGFEIVDENGYRGRGFLLEWRSDFQQSTLYILRISMGV